MRRPLPKNVFPQLVETIRLRLRRPSPGNEKLCAQQIFEAYATRREPLSPKAARSFGSFMVKHWERYGFGFCMVEVIHGPEESAVVVGHAGFKYIDVSPGHWGETFEAIELGFSLVPAARGRGYATEASRAALAVGFGAFDVPSIRGRCSLDNYDSAAVLLRCGMTELEPNATHRRFKVCRHPT